MLASAIVSFILAVVALAAPATSTVRTPHGERPIANVHKVPAGGEVRLVDSDIHLLDANGNVVDVRPNTNKASTTTAAVEPLETGWIAYAQWFNSLTASPIASFTTSWTVPAVPASQDGQTVFYFNSLVPQESGAIIQPVLQYGGSAAGGGAYWAVASWYLVGSETYYTDLTTVNVGDELDGVITLTSTDGTNYNYVTSFTNIPNTSITATNSVNLIWATETLEAYGIQSISDYPTGSTAFTGINIVLQDGSVPSFSWQAISDSADGITTTINVDGATNAEVTITY